MKEPGVLKAGISDNGNFLPTDYRGFVSNVWGFNDDNHVVIGLKFWDFRHGIPPSCARLFSRKCLTSSSLSRYFSKKC
ncbi:hypothetical protein CISECK367B_06110 [Citrobacter sedlakii]